MMMQVRCLNMSELYSKHGGEKAVLCKAMQTMDQMTDWYMQTEMLWHLNGDCYICKFAVTHKTTKLSKLGLVA